MVHMNYALLLLSNLEWISMFCSGVQKASFTQTKHWCWNDFRSECIESILICTTDRCGISYCLYWHLLSPQWAWDCWCLTFIIFCFSAGAQWAGGGFGPRRPEAPPQEKTDSQSHSHQSLQKSQDQSHHRLPRRRGGKYGWLHFSGR